VLVFGGGNILQDKTSALSLLYYALIARAARAHACKVAFTANGLGPFLRRKSLVLVKSALSVADYVSMREERSRAFAEFLTGKRVHLCADLAFAGEKAEKAFFCGEKYYAVFPKNVSKAEETELLRFFCAMRRHYGLIPVFVTLHKCEDRVICRTLAAKLPWAHYASDVRDEAGARALAKGACFTLAMRLHGAVFAVAEACPIIAAEGSEKTEAFFEGIGVPEGVRACKIHARLLCRAAAELLKTRKKSSAALKSAAEREMKKAQNELERLCAFIMQ
jgi:polysaccharide pyruvyl transferase WcaK-like protein